MRMRTMMLFRHTGPRVRPAGGPRTGSARCPGRPWVPAPCSLPGAGFAGMALMMGMVLFVSSAAAEEEPRRGGTLTYMIPAGAPPTFDAHREETYATIHSAAPFYSVLIRANPYDPGKTDDLVCDLCTAMPKPTDGGKTYTFKIREGVKLTDGSPLTADAVAANWQAS